jgi:hypothetical protein
MRSLWFWTSLTPGYRYRAAQQWSTPIPQSAFFNISRSNARVATILVARAYRDMQGVRP